jgi:hypothetical protein
MMSMQFEDYPCPRCGSPTILSDEGESTDHRKCVPCGWEGVWEETTATTRKDPVQAQGDHDDDDHGIDMDDDNLGTSTPKDRGFGTGFRYPKEKIAQVRKLLEGGSLPKEISILTGVAEGTVLIHRTKLNKEKKLKLKEENRMEEDESTIADESFLSGTEVGPPEELALQKALNTLMVGKEAVLRFLADHKVALYNEIAHIEEVEKMLNKGSSMKFNITI